MLHSELESSSPFGGMLAATAAERAERQRLLDLIHSTAAKADERIVRVASSAIPAALHAALPALHAALPAPTPLS